MQRAESLGACERSGKFLETYSHMETMALQHFCTCELWECSVMWSQAAEMCAEVPVEAGHADVVASVASNDRCPKWTWSFKTSKHQWPTWPPILFYHVLPPGMLRSSLQKKKVWICCWAHRTAKSVVKCWSQIQICKWACVFRNLRSYTFLKT